MSQDQWGYAPTPPLPSVSTEDRYLAIAAHAGSLIAVMLGGMAILAPLIVYLISGDKHYAREHAKESLNFQITVLIVAACAVIVAIMTLGLALLVIIPAMLIVWILPLIWIIQATIAANEGRSYRYPINIRFIR